MQLHVRLASGGDSSAAGAGSQDAASGLQKWALIELQGTIAALGGELAGVDLGGLNVLPVRRHCVGLRRAMHEST